MLLRRELMQTNRKSLYTIKGFLCSSLCITPYFLSFHPIMITLHFNKFLINNLFLFTSRFHLVSSSDNLRSNTAAITAPGHFWPSPYTHYCCSMRNLHHYYNSATQLPKKIGAKLFLKSHLNSYLFIVSFST